MYLNKIAVFAVSLCLAATASGGGDAHSKFAIVVDDGSGDGEIRLDLDSHEMGFDLHDMQEGESRSIVDKSGRTVLLTRAADGFKLDVDGKTIDLPMVDDAHGAVWIDGDHGENVDVQVMHDADFVTSESSDGVTIISGTAIDDATRESIRSVLMSSGYSGEVDFISGNEVHGGMHQVKIIRKEVEVTQSQE